MPYLITFRFAKSSPHNKILIYIALELYRYLGSDLHKINVTEYSCKATIKAPYFTCSKSLLIKIKFINSIFQGNI